MPARRFTAAMTLAGSAAAIAALWPTPAQVAELRVRAADTPEERLRALEARLAVTPGDEAVLLRVADGYGQAGRPELGLAALEARAKHQTLGRATLDLGRRLALAAGQPLRALALATGPWQQPRTDELTSLVDLALMGGDLSTGRRLQARLLAERPGSDAAIARARDMALMSADLKAAIAAQINLLANRPTPESAARLASLHLQGDRADLALEVLEAHPPTGNRAAWHHRAAQLAEWSRQPARALPHLRALYAAKPGGALGRRLLLSLVAAGHANIADFARKLAAAHPADAGLRREAADRLAAAGDAYGALVIYGRAVAAAPDDVAAHDQLVDFAMARSLRVAAISELGRWVTRRPRDVASQRRLAEVLAWEGRMREAWDVYERIFAGGRVPQALQLGWRKAWAGVSTAADDRELAMRTNLTVLAGAEPADLGWRRRLAEAAWAAGDREEALAQLRAVVARAEATPEDAVRLAGRLVAAGAPEAGLLVLRGTLGAAGTAAVDGMQLASAPGWAIVLGGGGGSWASDAAHLAAGAGRWDLAGRFFGRLAAGTPGDPRRWAELAAALEQAGDLPAAAAAWRRRLALGGASAADRTRYMFLLRAAAREREALAYFAAQPVERLDADALAHGAELARLAGDAALEESALRARLTRRADDVDGRLRLAELAAARGALGEADVLAEGALAIAPHSQDALYRVTASRFYGGRPDAAGPFAARLAALPDPEARTLALLADWWEPWEPRRAIAALDALHRATGGDTRGWFRRAELAQRLGDTETAQAAWARAAELGERGGLPGSQVKTPAAPDDLALRARALARLGREAEAYSAWQAVVGADPRRTDALLALARFHLEAGKPAAASPYLRRAAHLAPADPAVRRARADWLAAVGHPEDALPLLSALRRERPSADLALAEAQLRDLIGQRRSARSAAQQAMALDPSLADLTRGLRHANAARPRLFVRGEDGGLVSRQELGADAEWTIGERSRLRFEARSQSWGAGLPPGDEWAIGGDHRQGPWTAAGRVAVIRQGGQAQSPTAEGAIRWDAPVGAVTLGAAEARWADAPLAVSGAGRERRLEAEASFSPIPPVTLRARGEAGRLALAGQDQGASSRMLAEAAWRPSAAVPVALAYQHQRRSWGAAGPLVGLPEGVAVHAATATWSPAWGPVRADLTPGWALDAETGAQAPTFAAGLAWAPLPDAELTANLAVAGRSFALGQAAGWRAGEVAARWYF